MKKPVLATFLVVAGMLGGCAARQRFGYALPPNADVDALHANILSCADERNVSGRELLSRLWINVDADTLLIYNLRAPEDRRMTVRLDGHNMSEDEQRRSFDAAKQVGDALMACAQAKEATIEAAGPLPEQEQGGFDDGTAKP